MEMHDEIKVKTAGAASIKLVRYAHLVPTRPTGWLAARFGKVIPVRYELETGEPVQEISPGVWSHPSTGELLRYVKA